MPMTLPVSFSCVKHPMTSGEYICGECGHQYCPECVVFPFGASKAPLCISCALELGGVRRQPTNRPKLTRKSVRQRLALQRSTVSDQTATEDRPVEAAGEPDEVTWLDDSTEADDLPGGWKQSFPSS